MAESRAARGAPRRAPLGTQRKRDPDRTRRRILDAALAEFSEKGFSAARIADIADRAAVNKQLISYYFGGKEGLYRALIERWWGEETEIFRPDLPLGDVVAEYAMTSWTHREWTRLMMWEGLSRSREDRPRDQPDVAVAQQEHVRDEVAELRRRKAEGEIPDDLDPGFLMVALAAAAAAGTTMPDMAAEFSGVDPASESFHREYAEQLRRLVEHLRHAAELQAGP